MHDFFVSYCHSDHELVEALACQLRRRHKTVWWDQELRGVIGPWRDVVASAIGESRAVIAVLTSNSLSSTEVDREVQFADLKKKGVIPLVIGELDWDRACRGLLLRFAADQRIPIAGRHEIDRGIDAILAALDGIDRRILPDATPRLTLASLADHECRAPELDERASQLALFRALHHYLDDCARRRDWKNAEQLLDEIGGPSIGGKQPTTTKRWQAWQICMQWYDGAVGRISTWSQLAEELQGLPSTPPLSECCPVVSRRLEEEWGRSLDEGFERFRNCLQFGVDDVAEALRTLDLLGPEQLAPLASALPGLGRRSPALSAELHANARYSLAYFHGASGQDVEGRLAELRQTPWPPSRSTLNELAPSWRELDAQRQAVARFRDDVRALMLACGGQGSGAAALVAHLDDALALRREWSFDEVGALLTAWEDGLDRVTSNEDFDGGLERLDRAAGFFGGAHGHARLGRRLQRARAAWTKVREAWCCHDEWPSSLQTWSALEAVLGELVSGLQVPDGAHSTPADRWIRRLELERREVQRERALLVALAPLVAGDAAAALRKLSEPPTGLPRPDAQAWIEVCQAVEALVAIPTGEACVFLTDADWRAHEERVQRARLALAAARGHDAVLAQLRVPRLALAEQAVADGSRLRAAWARLVQALGCDDLDAGLDAARELSAASPGTAVVAEAVEALGAARQECAQIETLLAAENYRQAAESGTGTAGLSAAVAALAGRDFAQPLVDLLVADTVQLEHERARAQGAAEMAEHLDEVIEALLSERYVAAGEALRRMPSVAVELPEALRTNLALVERVAQHALHLVERLGDVAPPVELDPASGLPPAGDVLQAERTRIDDLRRSAQAVTESFGLLAECLGRACPSGVGERADAAVTGGLARLEALERYATECIAPVHQEVSRGDWAAALKQAEQFNADPALTEGWITLVVALRAAVDARGHLDRLAGNARPTGAVVRELAALNLSHPFVEPLRRERDDFERRIIGPQEARALRVAEAVHSLLSLTSEKAPVTAGAWLTTPCPAHQGALDDLRQTEAQLSAALDAPPKHRPMRILEALDRAVRSHPDLSQAATGELDAVRDQLRAAPARLPHNLGVAALARLRDRKAATSVEDLALAVGGAALFASCLDYRQALAAAFGRSLPDELKRESRALWDRVQGELVGWFNAGGIAWGRVSDHTSWACRWLVECYAVTDIQSLSGLPAPWRLGPALAEACGVEAELGSLLAATPALRVWYGPAAAAEAMLRDQQLEAALKSLGPLEQGAADRSRSSPGYRRLPDPPAAADLDLRQARSRVLLQTLRCAAFPADAFPDQGAAFAGRLNESCGALLALHDDGLDVAEPLRGAIRHHFEVLRDSYRQLRHVSTSETAVREGDARKRCMDGVIAFLAIERERRETKPAQGARAQPAQGWLGPCVRVLQALRAEVTAPLVSVKFDLWKTGGRPELLEEMHATTEQAMQDAPNDAFVNFLHAAVLMLKAREALTDEETAQWKERARLHLERALNKALAQHWAPSAIEKLNQLKLLAERPDASRALLERFLKRQAWGGA
jgi:hypothetical protein